MSPPDRLSREQLLHAAALAGDERAWQALYDGAFDGVDRYVQWRLAGRRAAVDEVVQETWLTAVRLLDRFEPRRGSFTQWLRGIASNALRNHLRRDALRRKAFQPFDESQYADASGNGTAGRHDEQTERADRITAALAALPDHYEEVLRAKYVDAMSVNEIAKERGQTPKAVESLLTRAREAFRAVYEQPDASR
ncbi:MAG: sigma-70 family RNA polymerase sigma factor [Pirellulales bacterium]